MPGKLLHRLLVAPLPYVPKSLVWPLSRRYVAGTTLDDAYDIVRRLEAIGCSATVDVLGEDSTRQSEVDTARDLYLAALDGIDEQNLNCNASIKLSDMGLRFDTGLCYDTLEAIVEKAASKNNFVRIDMEDSSVTSVTLDIYRKLRQRFDNVGTVVQSCLHRTQDDVSELLSEGIAHLRLCKGIYIEPEEISYRNPDDIRESYQRILEQLFAGGATKVGIATHDPLLVTHAEQLIRSMNIDKSRYEFQMLLGVAGTLRDRLVAAGHPLRVYVPFGERWHAYSMRRLRENPEIAMHILKNLFTR
ncbi:MAG: proline dehydrogenase family protein, partial [Woeseiaceae bacterium]